MPRASAHRLPAVLVAAAFFLAMAPSAVCFCEELEASEPTCEPTCADEDGGCEDEGSPESESCRCAQACCGHTLLLLELAAPGLDSEATAWLSAVAGDPLHGAEPLTPTQPPRA